MNIAIYYYSETGNTECVAQAIKRSCPANTKIWPISLLEQELIEDAQTDFDLVFIGTPIHGSDLPEKVKKQMLGHFLEHRKVALFFTHAAPVQSGTVKQFMNRIQLFFGSLHVSIQDSWHCRGENKRVDILAWLRFHEPEMYQEAVSAKGEPEKRSLQEAEMWANSVIQKMENAKNHIKGDHHDNRLLHL